MGFTGAHMLYYVLDVFILALYLLSHVCALLEYTFQQIVSAFRGELTSKEHSVNMSHVRIKRRGGEF